VSWSSSDGLTDATQHYLDEDEPEEQAAALAIRDSGPAALVAAAITDGLAASPARRTAMTLPLTGPLVGLLWLTALVPGRPPSALLLDRPEIGVSVLIGGLLAGLAVAANGPIAGRVPLPEISAVRAAAIACTAATVCDLRLVTPAVATPGLVGCTGWAAAVVSAFRLALTQRVARRDLVTAIRL
jgi:hypothetical protein